MMNFHCPDFCHHFFLYKELLFLYYNHNECFKDNIQIKSIFGMFPGASWNGGTYDEQILNILFLNETVKTKNRLLDTYAYLYHCPNDIKYWQEFNLNTLEKIKNFIFNDLWMLWIKDLGYDDFNNNGRTNPNLKQIYKNFQKKYLV